MFIAATEQLMMSLARMESDFPNAGSPWRIRAFAGLTMGGRVSVSASCLDETFPT
jgi:hypothetical protein